MFKKFTFAFLMIALFGCGQEAPIQEIEESSHNTEEEVAPPAQEVPEELDVCAILTLDMARAFIGCNSDMQPAPGSNNCKYMCTDPFGLLVLSHSDIDPADYTAIKERRDNNTALQAVKVAGSAFSHYLEVQGRLTFTAGHSIYTLQAPDRSSEELIELAETILEKTQ